MERACSLSSTHKIVRFGLISAPGDFFRDEPAEAVTEISFQLVENGFASEKR
jgi:hypothetical protein